MGFLNKVFGYSADKVTRVESYTRGQIVCADYRLGKHKIVLEFIPFGESYDEKLESAMQTMHSLETNKGLLAATLRRPSSYEYNQKHKKTGGMHMYMSGNGMVNIWTTKDLTREDTALIEPAVFDFVKTIGGIFLKMRAMQG